jgi:predicted metal-dependent hydrolase
MRIDGRWLLCDDGVVRPVIRGEVLSEGRSWEWIEFLVDTGADRTVLTAADLAKLGTRPVAAETSISGLGGKVKSTHERKQAVLDAWYRELLKEAIPPLVMKWERFMGVKVEKFFVQRMKTKWGSCNPRSRSIRINSELAKKPRECLEYIVVHEMVHLLEPTHNRSFIALIDQFMPKWQFYRDILNHLPVRHESWGY